MKIYGFTLVELLVVIAVLTVLLVAVAPSLRGSGTSIRKTSILRLQSLLHQARTEAVVSGEVVALVCAPLQGSLPDSLDGKVGRAVGLFQLDYDADARTFEVIKQLSRWQTIEKGVILANARATLSDHKNVFSGDVSKLALDESIAGDARFRFLTGAPFIAFSSRGRVLHPERESGVYEDAVFGLWEGVYEGGEARQTRLLPPEVDYFNTVAVNRLSGRARVLP